MASIAKRVVLFVVLNLAIVLTISLLLGVLGIDPRLGGANGQSYGNLLVYCLVWGMTGGFISLGLSRMMAKWMMGVRLISGQSRDLEERRLVERVAHLARAAGVPMPEVGIYDSPEVNAFATGPTRSRSLVAVSSGLLSRLNEAEQEGVISHELAHIANGDMVTMTLLQGVINAFVMFLARVLAGLISQQLRGNGDRERSGEGNYWMRFAIQMGLEMVFMILGAMLVAWFSRFREYRADAGGARVAGRDKMIQALEALKRLYNRVDSGHQGNEAFQSFKISGKTSVFLSLFASHPPLEDRIARLKKGRF